MVSTMERLRIVAYGESEKQKANARGKLFEKITAEVLRHHGYDIDRHSTNVTHAGMEIDIEGKSRITNVPLYAECKCYSSDVTSEKLQTFFGKYMTRWLRDNRCTGLFIALPDVNSYAKGFYSENCEADTRITVRLMQEPDVLDAIVASRIVIPAREIEQMIKPEIGSPGDKLLICSDKGFFWFQYIVPIGTGIASKIQLFDSLGHPITDQPTVNYLAELIPEMRDFEIESQPFVSTYHFREEPIDQVVELRGSSACFEYQFPASPEFFVGRDELLRNVDKYISDVIGNRTSSRGILFEANSGWGKSSLVLSVIARLLEHGHYAIAFDCRSASSYQFILKFVDHILDKFGDFDGTLQERPLVSGFDGAVMSLVKIGQALKKSDKLLCIFLDQFENVFYLLDLLTKTAQLCLKTSDILENLVIGFSWKTDLVGLTREFPYRWRDTIIDSCRTFRLKQFSEVETNALLDRLGQELHATLRRDLRFLLSEFSQGYPWLLKKLCAHVKNQRQAGIAQVEIARSLLNVDQLFQEDMEGLSHEQEEALRRIARLAPINISDFGEEFIPEVLQSLVDRRLIIKVGAKYDIYWDIFRDYLNTGQLPIEEVYLLRAQVGSIMKAVRLLNESGGSLETSSFKEKAGLSDGAFLNVARDLRLLQLANVDHDQLSLTILLSGHEHEVLQHLREHLNERLPRNRGVYNVLKALREKGEMSLRDLSFVLKDEFPYITAVDKTWETYARVLATWLDVSDLAVFDPNTTKVIEYKIGSQIRDLSLSFAPKRSGVTVPYIHFGPIVQVAVRIVSAAQKNEAIDWTGIPKSRIYKSLSVLEEMKLISRRSKMIFVKKDCYTFAHDEDRRKELAREAAVKWPVFQNFIEILNENASVPLTHIKLGQLISSRCAVNWKPETAKTNAKIMLDWARHLELAPGVHAYSQRGRFKQPLSHRQFSLFNRIEESKHDEGGEQAGGADG